MTQLTDMPNIGKTLAEKLNSIGIYNKEDLKIMGSERAFERIKNLENNGTCLNMLFALEGAIKGIRWHNLEKDRKDELKTYFRLKNL
jgi:DNA transformation protein